MLQGAQFNRSAAHICTPRQAGWSGRPRCGGRRRQRGGPLAKPACRIASHVRGRQCKRVSGLALGWQQLPMPAHSVHFHCSLPPLNSAHPASLGAPEGLHHERELRPFHALTRVESAVTRWRVGPAGRHLPAPSRGHAARGGQRRARVAPPRRGCLTKLGLPSFVESSLGGLLLDPGERLRASEQAGGHATRQASVRTCEPRVGPRLAAPDRTRIRPDPLYPRFNGRTP
jgi:hypothetical protein